METNFTPSHRGGSGSPLLLVHGFTDTWRGWDLIRPELEKHHDVLAVTLSGHAGGPPITGEVDEEAVLDELELAMGEAGFETAHIAGNSLGGYVSLKLAERGLARSVVAMAPAGGWAEGDLSFRDTMEFFKGLQEQLKGAEQHVDAIVATPEGRRFATQFISENYEHIPPELIGHQIVGAARCEAALPLIESALVNGWSIDPEKVTCPVRMIWGTEDKILRWPRAAARFRDGWFPNADWIELEGVGHSPQLDVPTEATQLILGFTAD